MASRRAPDPLGWINTSTDASASSSTSKPTRQGQRTISSFATPPPSTSKRSRLSDNPVLPFSGSRTAKRRQGDLRTFMHPTPPDSRSRPEASTQAASPLVGRQASQRKRTKSALSAVQQVWSDDEMEPTRAATPRQPRRRALAAKDPNISSGRQTDPIALASPGKSKSTQPMDLSSDDEQITPARARALAACKAIAPVRDKDRMAWNSRAPWITNPLPSPGIRGPVQPPASTPRKRKRDTPPPTAPADTKSAGVKPVLERSFSESIDPESLANFDFEKDVLDRVYRKDKPRPPVKHLPKALERSYTSPASLQGSDPPSDSASALTPLPSSDPPQQPEALIQVAAIKTEPKRDIRSRHSRTPSPVVPSSDSPHSLHSWAQTLFSQYPSPSPPPPTRRRQFVPAAQQEPETLLTWSAPVSSDPPAPESDTGSFDKLLEDEQDVMMVNAQSLALRRDVEAEENSENVQVSATTSSDPPTPSRHVTFAPTPRAPPLPTVKQHDSAILVPDSQESYHSFERAERHAASLEDYIPETLFVPAAPSSGSTEHQIHEDEVHGYPSIIPSSQSQYPLFAAVDRDLVASSEAPSQSTPRASRASRKPRAKETPQPKLSAFGFFPEQSRRQTRDFDAAFEDEAELSDGEAVVSSQTQAPLLPAVPMHPDLKAAGRREVLRRQAEQAAAADEDAPVPSSQASHEDRLSCLDELSSLPSDVSETMDPALTNWINGLDSRRMDAFPTFD